MEAVSGRRISGILARGICLSVCLLWLRVVVVSTRHLYIFCLVGQE
jgi:hypothetical protein